jgi:hypothetical protein
MDAIVVSLAAVLLAGGLAALGLFVNQTMAAATAPTPPASTVPLLPGTVPTVRVLVSGRVFVATLATTSATTTLPPYASGPSGGYTDLGVQDRVTFADGTSATGTYVNDTLVMQALFGSPPVVMQNFQLVTGAGFQPVLALGPLRTAASTTAATATLRVAFPRRTYVSSVLEWMAADPVWAVQWTQLLPQLYLGRAAVTAAVGAATLLTVPLVDAATAPTYQLQLADGTTAVLALGQTTATTPNPGRAALSFANGVTVQFPPSTFVQGAATQLGAPAFANRLVVVDVARGTVGFGPLGFSPAGPWVAHK